MKSGEHFLSRLVANEGQILLTEIDHDKVQLAISTLVEVELDEVTPRLDQKAPILSMNTYSR